MREWMTNAIMLGLACGFLVHFLRIGIYGFQLIAEPNSFILALEIVVMVIIIVFAILNFIKLARR